VDVPFSISSADEVNANEGVQGAAFGAVRNIEPAGGCFDGGPLSRCAGVTDGGASGGRVLDLGAGLTGLPLIGPVTPTGVDFD